MEKQTITIRRVGSVTFGVVLILIGSLFLAHMFFPQHYFYIYKFWPVILILLGIEVLVGTRGKNYEVLDEEGKVIEQSKSVYDFAAIIMMSIILGIAIFAASVYWGYETNGWF